VVTLSLSGPRVQATLAEGADDVSLVAAVDEATVVGLDAPLGWPDDFVAALGAHAAFHAWPAVDPSITRPERERLRLRTTDRFVRDLELGVTPLSVSSDLIGVVAMRAASLQSAWASAWGQREPRDGRGRLVETYPAAALRAWGVLASRGVRYKGGGGPDALAQQRQERQRITEEIESGCAPWLVVEAAVREAADRSDHALDALVCALVALATVLGATKVPPRADREVARREGWIHVPKTSFSRLGELLATR